MSYKNQHQYGISGVNKKMRLNVGAILLNSLGQVLVAQRIDHPSVWQFPQGGVKSGELLEDALEREVAEELGIFRYSYDILGSTRDWLSYFFPNDSSEKSESVKYFVGQKQKWFLLKWKEDDKNIQIINTIQDKPEFQQWKWVNYWYPLRQVASFKHHVYQRALLELRHIAFDSVGKSGFDR